MKKVLNFLIAIVFVGVVVSCEKEIKDDVSVKYVPQKVEKKTLGASVGLCDGA